MSELSEEDFDILTRIEGVDGLNGLIMLMDFVGHPQEMPSRKELLFLNPSYSADDIDSALAVLEKEDLIETSALDEENRKEGVPHEYYRLTEKGQEFTDRLGLFDEQELWQEAQSQLEKPDDIEAIYNAPRPNTEN